jgi:hypothetical protein
MKVFIKPQSTMRLGTRSGQYHEVDLDLTSLLYDPRVESHRSFTDSERQEVLRFLLACRSHFQLRLAVDALTAEIRRREGGDTTL